MLTLFPYLLDFQLIVPFLLRLALAVVLFSYCYKTLKRSRISVFTVWSLIKGKWLKGVVVAQLVVATMLVLGIFTQVAAVLALISVVIKEVVLKKHGEKCSDYTHLILFIAVCLSLLILGPGIFSLDLPL